MVCWCPALNFNAGCQSQAFATPTRLETAFDASVLSALNLDSPCVQLHLSLPCNPHACWLKVALPPMLCPESHGLGLLHQFKTDYRPPKSIRLGTALKVGTCPTASRCLNPHACCHWLASGYCLAVFTLPEVGSEHSKPIPYISTDSLFCRRSNSFASTPDCFNHRALGFAHAPCSGLLV